MKTPKQITEEDLEWMDAPLGSMKSAYVVKLPPLQIGGRIKLVRMLRNLTMRELASKCGVSQTAIMKWEQGEVPPNSSRITQLCKVLNIPVGVLFARRLSLQAEE